MLRHLVLIQDYRLLQRVRGFLSDTYGSTGREFPADIIEAQSLLITNGGTRFFITDIPTGITADKHLEEIVLQTHGDFKIIVICDSQRGIRLSAGNHELTVVPSNRLDIYLKRELDSR